MQNNILNRLELLLSMSDYDLSFQPQKSMVYIFI